jgi:hypothetical protein
MKPIYDPSILPGGGEGGYDSTTFNNYVPVAGSGSRFFIFHFVGLFFSWIGFCYLIFAVLTFGRNSYFEKRILTVNKVLL